MRFAYQNRVVFSPRPDPAMFSERQLAELTSSQCTHLLAMEDLHQFRLDLEQRLVSRAAWGAAEQLTTRVLLETILGGIAQVDERLDPDVRQSLCSYQTTLE